MNLPSHRAGSIRVPFSAAIMLYENNRSVGRAGLCNEGLKFLKKFIGLINGTLIDKLINLSIHNQQRRVIAHKRISLSLDIKVSIVRAFDSSTKIFCTI